MTVSNTNTKDKFITNGVTTVFPFTFYLTTTNQVKAKTIDSNGVETEYTNFTVTINPDGNGGSFTTGDVLNNVDLLVFRQTPQTQETDYVEGGRFPAESHEDALDKLTQQNQEQQEEIDRTLKTSIGSDNNYQLSNNLAEDELLYTKSNVISSTGTTLEDLNKAIENARLLGYLPPIPYAGGIVFDNGDNQKTIERNGIIYAPLPSQIPFTTSGTWTGDDENKFFVVQGITTTSLPTYTDLVYKASGGNTAVDNMIAGVPKAAGVGDICSTGGTTWERATVSSPSVISDFIPKDCVYASDFGLKTDGSEQSSVLQAFFDTVKEQKYDQINVTGVMTSSSEVNADFNYVSGRLSFFDLKINPTSQMTNCLTLQKITGESHVTGSISIEGNSITYDDRLCINGIRFGGVRSANILCNLHVQKVKGWGAYIDASLGNCNMASFRGGDFYMCGTGQPEYARKTFNYTGGTRSGSPNSFGQKCTITVDETYPEISEETILIINGRTYQINSVNGLTLDIYPWIPDADFASGSGLYVSGGGFNNSTGAVDAGVISIERITPTLCGVGARMRALYNGFADYVTNQFCQIGVVNGGGRNSSSLGGGIKNLYSEGNDIDVYEYSNVLGSFVVVSEHATNLSKWRTNSPVSDAVSGRLYNNTPATRFLDYRPQQPLSFGDSSSSVILNNQSQNKLETYHQDFNPNSPTRDLILNYQSLFDDFYNYNRRDVSFYIPNDTGSLSQTTIRRQGSGGDEASTIMGSASDYIITYPADTIKVDITVIMFNGDWRVFYTTVTR